VLLTGDFESAEFDAAVSWLRTRADVVSCAEFGGALEHLRQVRTDPLILVIAQSYPSQFSACQIEQMHRQAPLSRMVGMLGSWCEGEARSGRPWPGVIRIYWHQFESRMSRFLADSPDFQFISNLPRTSTTTDQLGSSAGLAKGECHGLVAVRTQKYTDYDALGEALGQIGYSSVWLNNGSWSDLRHATAIVWDGGSIAGQLDELRTLSDTAPVVALLNFPRHNDLTLIRKAGASAVVSRPFLTEDLQYQIRRVTVDAQAARKVA
jgi:hypothetical protein